MTFRSPQRIAPGQAPDGLVVHYYDLSGQLLLSRRLVPEMNDVLPLVGLADLHRASIGASAVAITFYDGDTGERFQP